MVEQVPPKIPEGWWEVVIVLFVIVSVFGAALLTQQDRPSLPGDLPGGPAVHLTRMTRLATPTPTKKAAYSLDTGEPTPGFTPGTPSPSEDFRQPTTPTPTVPVPSTVVGWTE